MEALRGALRVGSRKWDDGSHGNAVCHGLQALRGNGTMARGAWSVGALASAIVEIACGASERVNAGGDSQPADSDIAGMCAAVQDPACARVLWQLTALLHALTGDPELAHCGLGPQLRSALEAIALNAAAEVAESGGCSASGAPHADGSALQALLTKDGAFAKLHRYFCSSEVVNQVAPMNHRVALSAITQFATGAPCLLFASAMWRFVVTGASYL